MGEGEGPRTRLVGVGSLICVGVIVGTGFAKSVYSLLCVYFLWTILVSLNKVWAALCHTSVTVVLIVLINALRELAGLYLN